MTDSIKMYIFINTDLDMTAGKIASQVGHIVHLIVDLLVRSGYESFPVSEEYKTYLKWNKNCTKIVLKATEKQLKELSKMKSARAFYDNGQTTQVEQNSLTVVGFFPGSLDSDFVKDYKLL